MAFGVTEFKSNLFGSASGGGARPSLFKIGITDSSGSYSLTAAESILVKAGAIPASNIAPLPINYAGRAYKMSGFRTYDNWSTTILNGMYRTTTISLQTSVTGGPTIRLVLHLFTKTKIKRLKPLLTNKSKNSRTS